MAVTILRNASVLDPERGELDESQSVVVDGGRIADVGPGLTGPDDAVVVDVGGRTVMPGLIDAHTHPAVVDEDIFAMAEWPPYYVAARASRALEGMLMRGFTTIRDVGGGDWEEVQETLQFNGKILMVKPLTIWSTETMTDFRPVSSDLTVAQALDLLHKSNDVVAQNADTVNEAQNNHK